MKIALAQMKMTPEMEINYQKSIVSDYQGKTVPLPEMCCQFRKQHRFSGTPYIGNHVRSLVNIF